MPKTYYIITFGCQANLADSERIRSVLESAGVKSAKKKEKADFLIFNTCSVRQKAEDRVFGLKKEIEKLKVKNRKLKVVLTGCMMHYDREKLEKRLPFIDIFIDIKKIPLLPKMLGIKTGKNPAFDNKDYLDLEPKYTSKFSVSIPISSGCNNFCTYCIVPYARGPEKSRPAQEIIKQAEKAINPPTGGGAKEIWLLGQNVNSYKDGKIDFAKLLKMTNSIPGDFWIRFTSPHPKDFSGNLISAMTECEKFAHYLNLPLQSGDNTILKKMNRPYTVGHYKKLVKKIRKAIPGIAISTDIIVGFPGETKKQFENTAKIMKEIGFDMAFISEYSPRPGTAAAITMADNVPHKEKECRKKKLNEILAKTALENNKKLVGKTVKVLNNRTEGNKPVEIKGKHPKNRFINVKITKAYSWKLEGGVVKINKDNKSAAAWRN
jgi:tRNA-2-methylthio-N6-dimethylallyladenosine synthase